MVNLAAANSQTLSKFRNFQRAALELIVDSEFLLSGRLFLHIYVISDICSRL